MKDSLSIYILCGGKSSRMGTEKGLISFKEKPFVQHIIDAVSPLSDKVYLVTENQDYERFGLPLVPDLVPDRGPVGAIYTALKHTSSSWNLILSCDVPAITTRGLQTYLLDKTPTAPITFLSKKNQAHPLIGLYAKHVRANFVQALRKGNLKLRDLIEFLPHQTVEVSSEDAYILENVNTPEDLEKLIRTHEK